MDELDTQGFADKRKKYRKILFQQYCVMGYWSSEGLELQTQYSNTPSLQSKFLEVPSS